MKRLFIIGNGFDLFHNMRTSYRNFREFFEINDKIKYDEFNNLYESHHDRLWSDLEKTLGELDYEDDLFMKCSNYLLDNYTSEDWTDKSNFDFQYEINNYLSSIDSLKSSMKEWLKGVEYPTKKILNFRDTDEFITFNYTLTLEKLYSINDNKVSHIHNKIGEDIVLGHDNMFCRVHLNHHNPDHFDFRVQQSINIFNLYMEKYQKNTSYIIDENIDLFNKKYDEILVIGHSMNDVDIKYFEKISKVNSDTKWTIVYYSDNDKNNYQKRINELGIKKYYLISYTELIDHLR